MKTPSRLRLAHTPTPLLEPRGLERWLGGARLFVKHDDMTGGATAGNKVRKLEYLLADAVARKATTVITCGGLQSNHARATAICARQLGLNSVLLLRTKDSDQPLSSFAPVGNLLLGRLVGADIRLISPEQYRTRNEVMAEVAREVTAQGGVPYVIPEGGSNALGSLGYVRAMKEIQRQLEVGLAGGEPFDLVVHACGSGGTAAGVVVGAATYGVARAARAMAVCDNNEYFLNVVGPLVAELKTVFGFDQTLPVVIDDSAKGPAYAVASPEQQERIVAVARASGLLLDPVYTGKAFLGLLDMAARGELASKRVLFLHTGGLPGLLADGPVFASALG
jgi:D-cysteine desulfhydrase